MFNWIRRRLDSSYRKVQEENEQLRKQNTGLMVALGDMHHSSEQALAKINGEVNGLLTYLTVMGNGTFTFPKTALESDHDLGVDWSQDEEGNITLTLVENAN